MTLSSIIIGKGPVIIILHGLFGEGRNWMSIAKELAFNFEIHLIDQRNHGNSFHHIDHNYIVLAQDIHHYINKKNITKFSVIGHSMGGKVAMQLAFLYPNNLDKLIIVDIAPKTYEIRYSHIFQGLKEVLLRSKSRKEATAILTNYIQDLVVVNFLLKGLRFNKKNHVKLKFNLNAIERNVDNMGSFVRPGNTFDNMVYFLSGENSKYIKFTDNKLISEFFPVYKIIKITDSGHWIHFEQKEKFLNTINNILKEKHEIFNNF